MRGHIRKRGSKYVAVVDIGRDPDGKRQQRWYTAPTKRDAEAKLNDVLAKLQEGTFVAASRTTLGQYLTHTWLPGIKGRLRPNSYAAYEQLARNHVLPSLIAGRPMQRITAPQLNAFYVALGEKRKPNGQPLSVRTIRYVHTMLHACYRDAVKWGYCQRNPAQDADPPKATRKPEMRVWNGAQLARFNAALEGEPYGMIYRLLGATGARRGEIIGLRWRDVDLDAGRLAIQQTLVAVGYKVAVSAPKTDAGRRPIKLDSATRDAFAAYRKQLLEARMMLGRGKPVPDDLVFQTPDGEPIHPQAVSDRFDRIVATLGLDRIRLHDLRHSHATLALQAGISPKVVADRLGHSKVGVTLDIYSHVTVAMQEEAAELIASQVKEA